MQSPAEIVLDFIARINAHDADKLIEVMSEDHVFVDSLGQIVKGRESMRTGWRAYYALCPDYRIECERSLAEGDTVAVFGFAGGTIATDGGPLPVNRWRIPAAWLAIVKGGKLKEWRVYADNKPVYEILSKSSTA